MVRVQMALLHEAQGHQKSLKFNEVDAIESAITAKLKTDVSTSKKNIIFENEIQKKRDASKEMSQQEVSDMMKLKKINTFK
jgi:hypothetical protein